MVVLDNGTVRAEIVEKGAELRRITVNGEERLWSGDESVWSGVAPVLFPICGGVKDDKFTINVDISSKMYTYHCKYKLTEDTLKKLNKISSEFVKKEITSLLKTAQENNNDFLGIGNYIYKRNTNYFDFKDKSWDENLKNINFEVKSNVKIVSKGEVYESIGDKYGKNK